MLADAANVSSDGKANVLGVFTQFIVDSVPGACPACSLVLILEYENGDEKNQKLLVQWREPDGEVIFKQELNGEIDEITYPLPQIPIVINLSMLPLPKFGSYYLEISTSSSKYTLPILVITRSEKLEVQINE